MTKPSTNSSQASPMGGVNFLISIYHQENNTFQGAIQWLDTGQKIHFRSAIEMMLLIEEAASVSGITTETFRKWNNNSKTNVS